MKGKTKTITRRTLLGRSAAAAAGALAAPYLIPSTALGKDGAVAPSDRITIGLVGIGLMMRGHKSKMLQTAETQVLAVCDVWKDKREKARDEVEAHYAKNEKSGKYKGCGCYNEFEKIIERRDIDAVMVVTPDHWHASISLAAMRAGKDVYCQKPMTLTIQEGRVMSDTAKQYGAIFQTGSQQRSNWAFRKACEIVRNGWIGKIEKVHARLGTFAPETAYNAEPIPEGLDYDRWLGPAPWHPYNLERIKGNYGGGWRRFFDYGARKNGDWGAHHYDIIQWALGMDEGGAVEFIPPGYDGNEFQTHIYANGTRVLKNVPNEKEMIHFFGTEGEVEVSRGNRLVTTPKELAQKPLDPSEIHLYESGEHQDNWLECIRTRRRPICDAEVGHRSATVCHLSSIVERIGRPVKWDPAKEEIVGDEAAGRWVKRPMRAPWRL